MTATTTNFDQAELDKFGDLASRWWGEAMRLRESGGLSRITERTGMDDRAGIHHQGWFGATSKAAQ